MIVVADSGPIIHLSLIGQLDLLPLLYGRVIVPRAVFDEVVVAGRSLAGSAELAAADWIDVVVHDEDTPLHRALREELDPGEAAALSVASLRGADLVLMDKRLGRAVKRHGHGTTLAPRSRDHPRVWRGWWLGLVLGEGSEGRGGRPQGGRGIAPTGLRAGAVVG